MPVAFAAQGVLGYLDAFGPARVEGWIALADAAEPVDIDVLEDGRVVGRIRAEGWREDVAHSRQGDGRWGFKAAPPAGLADGRARTITLALADGRPILSAPIAVVCAAGAAEAPVAAAPTPPSVVRPQTVTLSIVVVFYNMQREAARTLRSLSRAYQQGAEAIGYEVICVDNGSTPPVDEAWVRSFGEEFNLVRPQHPLASPVGAMNAAARLARGSHVAMMIDGAHILTPGVLREVAAAVAETPGAVVGLRSWFVGGDQRFLSRVGWTRAQEDVLFARAGWPTDGYALFSIGTPTWESPNHWFDSMSESNCLFVPASVLHAIGGFDEAFDEPGAGFANPDLFRRAVDAAGGDVVALLGEATFHQFHEGTTTNVDTDEKDRRCRTYAIKYGRLRGVAWAEVKAETIRLRGQLRTRHALANRQRPLYPASVGVTEAVRPAELSLHYDEQAVGYLVSTYAEAGLADQATWLGEAIGVSPPDALAIADIVHSVGPSRIVAVHLRPGLRRFLADAVAAQGGLARLVVVGQGGIGGSDETDPADPAVLRAVRHAVGAATDSMVVYAPRSQDDVAACLAAYASFVSLRSYLVCTNAASGQPWLGYSTRWIQTAISRFATDAAFEVDTGRTRHMITSCPGGFLQRIGPVLFGRDEVAGARVRDVAETV